MATELKKSAPVVKEHKITLDNREKMTVTGVIDVISFNDDKIELKTNMNNLIIKGKNFNINQLDTDSGELSLNGEVTLMEYTVSKEKGSIFAGLFS